MRPLITRRHALAGFVVTSLAGSRVARADEPKRLIGVIEEDPPFFNPAVSSGISSFREGPESMSPKLLRHCGGRPCRLREIKAGKCASAQGLVA